MPHAPENTISFAEKLALKRQALQDPEVLESLRTEFEFRNKARRILAEQRGETNPDVLAELEKTITLEEMQEKAATLVA